MPLEELYKKKLEIENVLKKVENLLSSSKKHTKEYEKLLAARTSLKNKRIYLWLEITSHSNF